MKLAVLNDWAEVVEEEYGKPYFKELMVWLENEYKQQTIFPPVPLILNALVHTPLCKVKVVLLGQDPYHGKGQAQGLSFSVPSYQKKPPSLQNIYRELSQEYDTSFSDRTGDLTHWAQQGVLLLNSVLTVQEKMPKSHRGKGWERFTDVLIERVNQLDTPVVFLLWGTMAIKKKSLITNSEHLILETTHPSPLSAYRGFLGCGHFKRANDFLKKMGRGEISW